MHPCLKKFLSEYLGVVAATLVPVVLTAFLSMPMVLGFHPGERRTAATPADYHLT